MLNIEKVVIGVLLSGVAFQARICVANERDLRESFAAEAARALAEEDFARLEGMSATFRRERERTPSGTWKLALMYDALVRHSNYTSADERFWTDKEQRFTNWLKRYPQSPTAQIMIGKALSGRAWQMRGRRFANETPEANWEPFRKQLAVAREHMQKIKPTASVDPEWYRVMMSVALGEGWNYEQVQSLIDELISREPAYVVFYFSVIEYLTPKWHGSNSMIDQFAAWVGDRTQRTEGQAMYARIYWNVSSLYSGTRLFSEMKVDWNRMRKGFEDIIARYPDPLNVNHYARFACIAKDYETARVVLAKIDRPTSDVWGNGKILERCVREIDRLYKEKAPLQKPAPRPV